MTLAFVRVPEVTVARPVTIGTALRTPRVAVSCSTTDCGSTAVVVNGLELPVRTTQASAWKLSIRSPGSFWSVRLMPSMATAMPKTNAVTATAIRNRRDRYSRSRRLIVHMRAPPGPPAAAAAP